MSNKEKRKLQERAVSKPKNKEKTVGPNSVRTGIISSGVRLWHHLLFITAIAVITFLTFQPALNNKFLKTWDDPVYVTKNKLLHGLTAKNIGEIFSFHKELQKLTKNYHPLTTLSLSLNHQFAGLEPGSYYLTNILLHILNAILVYTLIFLPSERRIWAALFAGLFFAVHPLHVESVAWISERKDVLYSLFFLSGLIAYYYFVKKNRPLYLLLAFILFVLSVLSKAMAVVFPLVLLILDILLQRKWSWRVWVEKIPFFIISGFFGMLAIRIQSEGAINEWQTFSLYQRIMHASYGFVSYLYSFFIPSGLSALYPYPAINEHGQLPLLFRISPFVFMLIMALSAWGLFSRNRLVKVTGFGMLFYFVTLLLVLQFLSVGKAITADRYTYIPYIGVFFIIGAWWSWLLEHRNRLLRVAGFTAAALFMVGMAAFSSMANQRTAVWHDDIALWSDALAKYPDGRMNFIRVKRADMYFNQKDYTKAMDDYRVIVALDPNDDNALEHIGRIYGEKYHQLDSALVYLNRAYKVNPENIQLLKNLGVAYAIKNEFSVSLGFLLAASQKDPADTALMRNIAATYRSLGNLDKSEEFEKLSRRKK